MSHYIAFLRAINVGGHTVKMDTLRRHFESFGFSEVETFIASGNVIFRTTAQNTSALESQIASGLQASLGYEVSAFIRTPAELTQIAAYQPFPRSELYQAVAFNIAFLYAPLDQKAKLKLMELSTEIDAFAAHARQVYWLCHRRQSESTFSNLVLEKTLGIKTTFRGINTINRLIARLGRQGSLNE
jgi:uncharacterized protein (DUF1697 family)